MTTKASTGFRIQFERPELTKLDSLTAAGISEDLESQLGLELVTFGEINFGDLIGDPLSFYGFRLGVLRDSTSGTPRYIETLKYRLLSMGGRSSRHPIYYTDPLPYTIRTELLDADKNVISYNYYPNNNYGCKSNVDRNHQQAFPDGMYEASKYVNVEILPYQYYVCK